ncbi:SUN domain-containing protein 3 isoform 2-T2 [Molossus nigricans]
MGRGRHGEQVRRMELGRGRHGEQVRRMELGRGRHGEQVRRIEIGRGRHGEQVRRMELGRGRHGEQVRRIEMGRGRHGEQVRRMELGRGRHGEQDDSLVEDPPKCGVYADFSSYRAEKLRVAERRIVSETPTASRCNRRIWVKAFELPGPTSDAKRARGTYQALLRETQTGLHGFNDSWKAGGDPAEAQDHPEAVGEEMSNLVNYVLKKLREDQVQMADYALKSAGASIIEAGTSESYRSDTAKLYWHGIGFLSYEMPPDSILQPDVHPGKCWAFPGSQGHALIKLAGRIIPTAVTMEHISEKVSPSGSISSAPKEFSVHGISSECEGEETSLGQFVYNKTGDTVQTFELQREVSEPILCVKLKILSNWGHPKYTCLYRFRVHGSPEDHS